MIELAHGPPLATFRRHVCVAPYHEGRGRLVTPGALA